MELQVQDLISEIKRDGISKANMEAEKIIEDANKKAAEIIENANAEAKSIEQSSAQRIETLKVGAIDSIEQAERDAVLLFKGAIKDEMNKILISEIDRVVRGETLADLIKVALNNENPGDYEVEINEVTDGIKAKLKKEISEGLDIKLANSQRTGFKLMLKDGSGYFDLDDEEIKELLKPLFSAIDL